MILHKKEHLESKVLSTLHYEKFTYIYEDPKVRLDEPEIIVRKIIKVLKLISTINCLEPPNSLSENPLCGFELRY